MWKRCLVTLIIAWGLLHLAQPSVTNGRCSVRIEGVDGPLSVHNYLRHGRELDTMIVNYKVTVRGPPLWPVVCPLIHAQVPSQHISRRMRGDTYLIIFLTCPIGTRLDTTGLWPNNTLNEHIIISRLIIVNCVLSMRLLEGLAAEFRLFGVALIDSALYSVRSNPERRSVLESLGELTLKSDKRNMTLGDLPLGNHVYPSVMKLGLVGLNLPSLPADIQRNFPAVVVLSLGGNSLTSPPLVTFVHQPGFLPQNLSRAERLNSGAEYLKELDTPSTRFPRVLDLCANDISTITRDSFRGSLDLLDLSWNRIELLRGSPFAPIRGLQTLNLGKNQLSVISSEAFRGLTSLVRLHLSHNNIVRIDPDAFRDLANLQLLNLGNNALTVISRRVLKGLQGLKQLTLESNRIRIIESKAFVSTPYLTEINLGDNPLLALPGESLLLTRLSVLDLSYTGLQLHSFVHALNQVPFKGNAYRQYRFPKIVFRGNNITSMNFMLSNSTNRSLYSKVHTSLKIFCFDFSENPLSCDCDTSKLLLFLGRYEDLTDPPHPWRVCWSGWVCRTPEDFAGRPILSLDPQRLYCPTADLSCPSECHCYNRYNNSGGVVKCENNLLRKLPETMPNDILDIRLANNQIQSLKSRSWLERVERLYLTNNSISRISRDIIRTMSNLSHLHIDSNRLTNFPSFVTQMDLVDIRLADNPFRCFCENLWFKDWLVEHKSRVSDWERVTCHLESGREMLVIRVQDEDLGCSQITYFGLILSVSVVTLCFLLLGIAVVHFRQDLRVLWFVYHSNTKFNLRKRLLDKEFVAYVVFAEPDRSWSEANIIKPLMLHFMDFKIAVQFDSFVPGERFVDGITRTINASAIVVVVLSRELLSDEWCFFALTESLSIAVGQNRNFVVLIKRGQLRTKHSPSNILQSYLKMKRYLCPMSRLFQQKLLYSVYARVSLKVTQRERHVSESGFSECSVSSAACTSDAGASLLPGELRYDVGVLYGDTETHWVVCELLPLLEAGGRRVCLPDRDPVYVPGDPDKENILRLLHCCRQLILVVSREFVQTDRCLFIFRAARDRSAAAPRFTMLLTEDLGVSVPVDVLTYLRSHVCLDREHPQFKRKLKKILECMV